MNVLVSIYTINKLFVQGYINIHVYLLNIIEPPAAKRQKLNGN